MTNGDDMATWTEERVTTPDGSCPVVLATPETGGPWPAVVLFMDAGGVRPALVAMAERLADLGYVVAVPELYYRHGEYAPFDTATAFTDPDERTRLFAMLTSLTPDGVAGDTGAVLDFLSGRPEVAGQRVGTTGYCMGGGISLAAAARFPDRVGASASFHGGNLATDAPDSPHRLVSTVAGRVYVAAATDDGSFPPEQQALLEEALTEAGVDHTIETYPAAHGFAVPDMPTYDVGAAERHWVAVEELFGATLTS